MKTRLLKKIRKDFQIGQVGDNWVALPHKRKDYSFQHRTLSALILDIVMSWYELYSVAVDHTDLINQRKRQKEYRKLKAKLN